VPAHRPLALRPAVWLLAVLATAVGFGLRMTLESKNAELGNDNTTAARSLAVVLAEPDDNVLDLELSPDGSRLAWTQFDGVYIRSLDEFDVIKVDFEGTQAAGEHPASLTWSPDGTQIAFTSQGALWRISAEGEHVTLVTRGEISLDTHSQLAWTRDGQLVYSDGKSLDLLGRSFLIEKTTPLFSADGETTTHFDGVAVLPDDTILVVRHRKGIGEPDTLSHWRDGELRDVLQLPGWNMAGPAYSDGHLVFERRDSNPNSIWTVPFDLEAGEAVGNPQPVVDHGVRVSLSEDGSLAYVLPSAPEGYSSVWMDLQGGVVPVGISATPIPQMPVMSRDCKQVLISNPTVGGTVWAHDIARGRREAVGELELGWIVLPGGTADGRIFAMNVMDPKALKTAVVPSTAGEPQEHFYDGAIVCVSRDGTLGLGLGIRRAIRTVNMSWWTSWEAELLNR
jgi:hypothetical protein